MKKQLSILLTIGLLMGLLAACGNDSSAPAAPTATLSVEKAQLLEKPYVTVSTDAISQEGTQYTLDLAVQNKGSEAISVLDAAIAANGLTIPFDMEGGGHIPANTNDILRIYLDCSSIFLWGMDKLETIDLNFTLSTKYSSDAFSVTVPVKQEGTNGKLALDGETILDSDGVKVQYKVVDNWPVYLLENKTDKELILRTNEFRVNGLTEHPTNPDWKNAAPGQTILSSPQRLSTIYVPQTDTTEISFNVYVKGDKDFKLVSETATYEAPFIFDNCGLNEDFFSVYDDGTVSIRLGFHQTEYQEAPDVCIWIQNNSDQELVVNVNELLIDGRSIQAYELYENMSQYYYKKHTLKPHTEEIQSLTWGECGTPQMYGGIKEVCITLNLLLGDDWGIVLDDIVVPFQ